MMEYTEDGKRMRILMNSFGNILDETYSDKKYHIYDYGFGCPPGMFLTMCDIGKPIITEGLIHTYSPEVTISYISKAFKLPKESFTYEVVDSIPKIYVRYFPDKTSEKLLKAAFEYCGYFFSKTVEEGYSINGAYKLDAFEEKNPKDNTQEILSSQKYLLHLTPSYNENKILKNGIVPKFKNDIFNFPERVYLLNGDIAEGYILGLGFQLSKPKYFKSIENGTEDVYQDNRKWTVFKLESKRLPDNIRLFKDPNYEGGIFTPNNIPPTSIVDIGHIDYSRLDNDEEINIVWENILT